MIQNLLQRFNIEKDIASVELPEGLIFPVTTMEELDKALEILTNVTTQKILVIDYTNLFCIIFQILNKSFKNMYFNNIIKNNNLI